VDAFIQREVAHVSQACAERLDVCHVDGVGSSREDEALAVGRNIGAPNTEAGLVGEPFSVFRPACRGASLRALTKSRSCREGH